MVELHDISVRFGETVLFDHLNLRVHQGEKVVLQGRSGSGKTTLLHLLMGFLPPEEGEIIILNDRLSSTTVKQVRQQMAWVPQAFPHLDGSVSEVIHLPFQWKANQSHRPSDSDIEQWFEAFDLPLRLLHNSIKSVSGGERQRIGLIIALLLDRPLLLLDEPSSNLDTTVKEKVGRHLFELPGKTVLSTSHDPEWVQWADRTIPIRQNE